MDFDEYRGLEQHHVKYIERDGVDEIILVTPAEHYQIHKELSFIGVATVPKDIIRAAHFRSPRYKLYTNSDRRKEQREKYNKSIKTKQTRKEYWIFRGGKEVQEVYRKTDAGKKAIEKSQANTEYLSFSESFGKGTSFREKITFNKNTGHVGYTAYFRGCHCDLPVIANDTQ